MTTPPHTIDVYLECGTKRIFANACDWPGWSRSGRNEAAALQALVDSGPRYARVLQGTGLGFHAPADPAALVVVDHLAGNTTTDFGAPDIAPPGDSQPLDEPSLQRFQTLLQAYWRAFDEAVAAAIGKELRKGPRGGGRKLEQIVDHMIGADTSYLRRLAWKFKCDEAASQPEQLQCVRQAMLEALTAATRGELPERGPRGGVLWSPRYFVRRVGWHVLDHAWEIEERSSGGHS